MCAIGVGGKRHALFREGFPDNRYLIQLRQLDYIIASPAGAKRRNKRCLANILRKFL
ncbi:MAG: hypothetical protein ABFD98_05820 [Syntrophobacteraceae bacterium]|nr:hypothetical protein [Desulfobacteraceae bacterium]